MFFLGVLVMAGPGFRSPVPLQCRGTDVDPNLGDQKKSMKKSLILLIEEIRLSTWHLCNPANNGVQGFLNHQQYCIRKWFGHMKRLSMKRIWRDNTFEETYQFSGHQISKTQFVWYTFESRWFFCSFSVLLSQELTSAWQVCFWVEGNAYFQMSLLLSRKPNLFCMGLEDNIMYSEW